LDRRPTGSLDCALLGAARSGVPSKLQDAIMISSLSSVRSRRRLALALCLALLPAWGCESDAMPATMAPAATAAGSGGGPATPAGAAAGAGGSESLAAIPLPFLGAAGIGVSDLEASYQFYTSIFGMTLRYELPVPGYVNERIMYFKDSMGSDVVLMNFIDGMPHNYVMNPVKLVFYVPSATAVIEAIRARGLAILSEPAAQPAFNNTVIGFARDPDGYILEIIEQPQLKVSLLGAIGIGVSDLEKSKDFYERVMGMRTMGDLISVPGVWDEYILQHATGQGSAIVIMTWTDGMPHNYKDNPIKTVHFVQDSRALAAKVEQEGLRIFSPPTMYTVQGVDVLIAMASDPDGYALELVTTL
jgi:lactoylglutathione lyase